MADKLQFELVSPEKLLLSEAVDMVVVPGSEGNFGVLPGHSLLISTVRPGVIDVYSDEQTRISERIFVSGGFAEVTPERCTVLADEATPVAQLSRTDAEQRVKEAEAAYADASSGTPEKRDAAMDRLLSARAMLQAALAS